VPLSAALYTKGSIRMDLHRQRAALAVERLRLAAGAHDDAHILGGDVDDVLLGQFIALALLCSVAPGMVFARIPSTCSTTSFGSSPSADATAMN
jgi:hypothetical protein